MRRLRLAFKLPLLAGILGMGLLACGGEGASRLAATESSRAGANLPGSTSTDERAVAAARPNSGPGALTALPTATPTNAATATSRPTATPRPRRPPTATYIWIPRYADPRMADKMINSYPATVVTLCRGIFGGAWSPNDPGYWETFDICAVNAQLGFPDPTGVATKGCVSSTSGCKKYRLKE